MFVDLPSYDEHIQREVKLYDIDSTIGVLEAIQNDGVLLLLNQLDEIKEMIELAYKKEDGLAYAKLLEQELVLFNLIKQQTKEIRAELDILYKAKEICLRYT